MRELEAIRNAVIEFKKAEINHLVQAAIADGVDLNTLLDALIGAMDEVGRRFASAEIYVPEMLASALTMKEALNLIKPLLLGYKKQTRATILIGTVKGDLHDIGKNIVIMMLEGAGFEVIDLGVDLREEVVIDKVRELKPQVLGLSALLTTTMPEMGKIIKTLEQAGLREQVKVIVGGAPIDEAFASKIGADGYARDAVAAVESVKRFIGN
jgi:5-methyltetrahydrofolate--homocysteine methyltransferase